MDVTLQAMTMREFVRLQEAFGIPIVESGGQYWRRVRPFFYRPLLPVAEIDESEVRPPSGWPSGYQYVVTDRTRANSTMNFIMLDTADEYSLSTLGHKRRNLINSAARRFSVRVMTDFKELNDEGYRAFLSFYKRTGYSYKAERRNRAGFETWVDTLAKHPKILLLGGYGVDGLAAVSCSYLVNRTLVYATLFGETQALKKNLGELMFHELRVIAARTPAVSEIYIRTYQGGNSLDQYYLLRGAKLVKKPARLQIPMVTHACLKMFMPEKHQLILGDV